MWPMPPFNKRCIIIHFSPHHITCSWFEHNNKATLKAYKTVPLENLELERLIIFNPSRISNIIQSFLDEHHLKHACSLFCLNGPSLKQQIVTCKAATFSPEKLELSTDFIQEWEGIIWDYSYLYPSHDGKYVFYIAGISRELLFQYQLLAMQNHLNLTAISPEAIGLLSLYKIHKGAQFRHSQLGIELNRHNNDIAKMFDEKILRDIAHSITAEITTKTYTTALLASLGLFLTRNT